MLKITNNKESFIIENERLKKFENYYKYVNQNKNICVELLFLYEEKNKNYLYVHWLDSTTDDGKKAAKIIKGKFEKYIRRIFD